MESLEYSGFVHSLGVQWFIPSIQAAVDFIEKHRSVSRVVGNVIMLCYQVRCTHVHNDNDILAILTGCSC